MGAGHFEFYRRSRRKNLELLCLDPYVLDDGEPLAGQVGPEIVGGTESEDGSAGKAMKEERGMSDYELYRHEGKAFRSVRARVDDNGFTIETQDLGEATKQFWGDSDYEYWTTVPREEWGNLLVAFAKEFFADDAKATDRLAEICRTHGVRHTWNSWV